MENRIERIDMRSMLEQVTEECGELVQACMKLIRAMGNGNPTTVSEEEAVDKLIEEYSDVVVAAGFLLDELQKSCLYDISARVSEIGEGKIKRWNERLEELDEEDGCCSGDDFCSF